MDRKLTAKQAEALALIEDNPRRVEANSRIAPGMTRINGNVENWLYGKGMIAKVEVGTQRRTIRGQDHDVTIFAWKLTEAGRKALRSTL